jgi:hypothetical protein
MKKRLIQKLQQLRDVVTCQKEKQELIEDIRKLKLSDSDYFVITLANKYKNQ